MKKALELILKKAGKDWEWLIVNWLMKYLWAIRSFHSNLEIREIFEKYPKLLTLLVIDLAPELWRGKYRDWEYQYSNWVYKDKLYRFINAENKVEWITKELEVKR